MQESDEVVEPETFEDAYVPLQRPGLAGSFSATSSSKTQSRFFAAKNSLLISPRRISRWRFTHRGSPADDSKDDGPDSIRS